MTDEGWNTLLPATRTEILTRGEAMMGSTVYTLSKDKFYEFCDKALAAMMAGQSIQNVQDIERMRQAVIEYDEAMAAKASMGE